jgi:ABC-type tungstate transport system substrate-binding protein
MEITSARIFHSIMESAPEERTPAGSLRSHPNRAIYGPISLYLFVGAVAVALFFMLTASSSGYTGATGFGYFIAGIVIGCFACVLSVVFAFIGLIRREYPRWPAITGLILSLIPALGALYILCGAPL